MIGSTETLKLSDTTSVDVGVLDGDEADSADLIVASRSGGLDDKGNMPIMAYAVLGSKIYGVCSIRRLNGEEVRPLANEAEYRKVAKRLTIAEIKALGEWARPHYSPSVAETKNDPSAPESVAE